MARPLRFQYPGAVYHVMARGDGGKKVFETDDDRLVFLKRLEETCGSCGWRVHAWVLMGNHFHLLLETPQPTPISPPTGPATGSSNGLHPKSKFLAITSASVYQVSSVTSGRSREFATPLPWQHSPWNRA